MLKVLPLEEEHKSVGAKFFEFANWWMPLEYSGILKEHLAVRNLAGIFDISHMGRILISGKNAHDFLQYITSNDVYKLYPGKAQYSLILTPNGTITDDIIVYMLSEENFFLVVNAINTEKILSWLNKYKPDNIEIKDITSSLMLMALQGPKSEEILQKITDISLNSIKYYHFSTGKIFGEEAIISRTGYTGEDGFEIVISSKKAGEIFIYLVKEENVVPCGLGARDTLRLEMGYPLYGHEIDENTTPWEANLDWVVKLNKNRDFIGKDALIEKKDRKEKFLIAFELLENSIPRQGYEIYNNKEEKIGYVTSGNFSPVLKKGIGMGYIYREIDSDEIKIKIREKLLKAKVVKTPFIKNTSLKRGERKNVS